VRGLEGALAGTRVLDVTRLAPGPFCTELLADMGAEVWKVEAPSGGDPLRALSPPAFETLNAGKKSVTLNLKAVSGRELFLKLAERADVLVEGFRPGVMADWGLSYRELHARIPTLVYASITGYGQDGPDRHRAGHDINYMAKAGALGREVPPVQVADFAGGGLFAAFGIVAALHARDRTRRGAYVDVSMADGVRRLTSLLSSPAGDLLSGRYPCYGIYETADAERLTVGALEPKFWETFCEAIERPDLRGRSFDAEARPVVADALRTRSLDHWKSIFDAVDACVEPVTAPEPPPSRRPAPRLGEHTAPLLELSPAEASRLSAEGVI